VRLPCPQVMVPAFYHEQARSVSNEDNNNKYQTEELKRPQLLDGNDHNDDTGEESGRKGPPLACSERGSKGALGQQQRDPTSKAVIT